MGGKISKPKDDGQKKISPLALPKEELTNVLPNGKLYDSHSMSLINGYRFLASYLASYKEGVVCYELLVYRGQTLVLAIPSQHRVSKYEMITEKHLWLQYDKVVPAVELYDLETRQRIPLVLNTKESVAGESKENSLPGNSRESQADKNPRICFFPERFTHGSVSIHRPPVYSVWMNFGRVKKRLKDRCCSPINITYDQIGLVRILIDDMSARADFFCFPAGTFSTIPEYAHFPFFRYSERYILCFTPREQGIKLSLAEVTENRIQMIPGKEQVLGLPPGALFKIFPSPNKNHVVVAVYKTAQRPRPEEHPSPQCVAHEPLGHYFFSRKFNDWINLTSKVEFSRTKNLKFDRWLVEDHFVMNENDKSYIGAIQDGKVTKVGIYQAQYNGDLIEEGFIKNEKVQRSKLSTHATAALALATVDRGLRGVAPASTPATADSKSSPPPSEVKDDVTTVVVKFTPIIKGIGENDLRTVFRGIFSSASSTYTIPREILELIIDHVPLFPDYRMFKAPPPLTPSSKKLSAESPPRGTSVAAQLANASAANPRTLGFPELPQVFTVSRLK